MFARLKSWGVLATITCVAIVWTTTGTLAITVEVAKKCNALTAKAYPPRVVGNPAAGSANGNAQDQRDYFGKCVSNGGNMDNQPSKDQPSKDAK